MDKVEGDVGFSFYVQEDYPFVEWVSQFQYIFRTL